MAREKLLSVLDIAQELNTGKATIKFLLKRFKKWAPSNLIDGQPYYSNEIIKILIFIQEKIEMGVLPSKIETQLDAFTNENLNDLQNVSRNEDITIDKSGLELIKTLFNDMGSQQERIAKAHEKRAQVEERKAVAIEKRAMAEEKKAIAMNNIATALQEMNQHRSMDSSVQQIAHEAASIIASDESNPKELSKSDKTHIETDDLSVLIQDSDDIQSSDAFDELDIDLSSLLDEDNMLEEFTADDDLSEMLDQEFDDQLSEPTDAPEDNLNKNLEIDDLSLLVDEDVSNEIDDLSQLLDTSLNDEEPPVLDDLFSLLEPSVNPSLELDDLSKLIDNSKDTPPDNRADLDDLSKLIDNSKDSPPDNITDLDDLSKLIDNSDHTEKVNSNLDDLSLLIDQPDQMDDLSKLIDKPQIIDESKNVPSIKIDISPKDDLKKYKAAVMQIIIKLNAEGLSADETTKRLNDNKIETLSGKPAWTSKAISQVYKFIDSAK